MKNFVQEGKVLTLASPYARSSGQGALVGSIFGVATKDLDNGASGEFLVEGVVELVKVGSQAWTVGAKIYWDDTNKYLTTTAMSNTFVGHCLVAVGSGAGEVLGRIVLRPAGA